MIQFFNTQWHQVPIVVIDTETTGIKPGVDKAVSVALVRFEQGKFVDSLSSFIDPRRPIPSEASAIHGITGSDVDGAPTIDEFFGSTRAAELLRGAQPAAYNAQFDREFVTREAFEDWAWPWLDPLVFVRAVDRYAKGKDRHTLLAACERHNVQLNGAHSALHDARAAGELLFKVARKAYDFSDPNLCQMLAYQMRLQAGQWMDFQDWKARQPVAAQ